MVLCLVEYSVCHHLGEHCAESESFLINIASIFVGTGNGVS